MATDLIRYDLLVQNALRSVVKKVLGDAAREGVPGEHYYYISFLTTAPGVRVSNRLREKYPDEMTIVLQHQFWDLGVTDHSFEVGLAFGGIPERLLVPFEAVTGFFDPSVKFALKFEADLATQDDEATGDPAVETNTNEKRPQPKAVPNTVLAGPQPVSLLPARTGEAPAKVAKSKSSKRDAITDAGKVKEPVPGSASQNGADQAEPRPLAEGEARSGAEVVSLDAFRKKS